MAAPNHLNVLVIVNRLFEWSQNFITRELVELSRQGVTLHVGARRIVPRDDLTTEEDHILDRYLRVPENPFLPSYFFRHALFNLKHPINYLRAWKELFTFGHRQPSKWGRSLVCLFRAAAIADEVIKREINLIHAHFMTAPAETALYLSVLTGVPFGCTAHAMDIYKDNSGLSKKMQKADYVTTCTEANLEFLNQRFPAHREKTFRVYHGIAAGGHNSNRGLSESPVAFLAVGRLSPKKGFNYLLDACQILKTRNSNFRCLIVGEGPLEKELKTQIRNQQLSDIVELKGYVAPNQISKIYAHSDVLVVPSVIDKNGDRDGLPNVCLEALTHGLPIIASNVSGIPEAVVDGVNGRLVPPAEPVALAEAMASLLSAANRLSMREATQTTAKNKFNLSMNVSELRSIMASLKTV